MERKVKFKRRLYEGISDRKISFFLNFKRFISHLQRRTSSRPNAKWKESLSHLTLWIENETKAFRCSFIQWTKKLNIKSLVEASGEKINKRTINIFLTCTFCTDRVRWRAASSLHWQRRLAREWMRKVSSLMSCELNRKSRFVEVQYLASSFVLKKIY